jgi:3-deoxy-D-manno-octulosonate 8-phosphate phosphatase KdsC-like HAD superfamily phosphatase
MMLYACLCVFGLDEKKWDASGETSLVNLEDYNFAIIGDVDANDLPCLMDVIATIVCHANSDST